MWNSFGTRSLIASLFMQASVAAIAGAAPAPSCRAATPQELRVHLVDDAGVDKETIDAARAEAAEIWRRAGLELTWTFSPDTPGLPDGRSIIVVIRRDLTPMAARDAISGKTKKRRPLGWLVFDEQGRGGRLIEVSFAATAMLMQRGTQTDAPITALPAFARFRLLGRGLGRVIAHEIGHWLMGRGHVGLGLMKARFNAIDLVDFRAPSIPELWLDASDEPTPVGDCAPRVLQRLTALDLTLTTQTNSATPSAPQMARAAVLTSAPN